MSTAEIERRLRAVEGELARLKAEMKRGAKPPKKGWRNIVGSFAGDPLHAEAAKLGRQYREAQRPKRKRA
jgi:hypothetical protein